MYTTPKNTIIKNKNAMRKDCWLLTELLKINNRTRLKSRSAKLNALILMVVLLLGNSIATRKRMGTNELINAKPVYTDLKELSENS